MAYLNSTVVKELYQSLSGETRQAFPQVHLSMMRTLPVPKSLLLHDHPTTCTMAKLAQASQHRQNALTDSIHLIDQCVRSMLSDLPCITK